MGISDLALMTKPRSQGLGASPKYRSKRPLGIEDSFAGFPERNTSKRSLGTGNLIWIHVFPYFSVICSRISDLDF